MSRAVSIGCTSCKVVIHKPISRVQPLFLQELRQKRGEQLPELRVLLEQNFLQDERRAGTSSDPSKQVDLEKLWWRELLREYAAYTGERGKLKSMRLESVRASFEEDLSRSRVRRAPGRGGTAARGSAVQG